MGVPSGAFAPGPQPSSLRRDRDRPACPAPLIAAVRFVCRDEPGAAPARESPWLASRYSMRRVRPVFAKPTPGAVARVRPACAAVADRDDATRRRPRRFRYGSRCCARSGATPATARIPRADTHIIENTGVRPVSCGSRLRASSSATPSASVRQQSYEPSQAAPPSHVALGSA